MRLKLRLQEVAGRSRSPDPEAVLKFATPAGLLNKKNRSTAEMHVTLGKKYILPKGGGTVVIPAAQRMSRRILRKYVTNHALYAKKNSKV